MEARTSARRDDHALAAAILAALLPSRSRALGGLDEAIRLELLVTALQDATTPRSLGELQSVLERIAVGEVARGLVDAVRERAAAEPHLLLAELA